MTTVITFEETYLWGVYYVVLPQNKIETFPTFCSHVREYNSHNALRYRQILLAPSSRFQPIIFKEARVRNETLHLSSRASTWTSLRIRVKFCAADRPSFASNGGLYWTSVPSPSPPVLCSVRKFMTVADGAPLALIMPVRAECCSPAGSACQSTACLVPPGPINTQQPGVATSLLYSGSQFRGHQKSKGNSYDVDVVLQVMCDWRRFGTVQSISKV